VSVHSKLFGGQSPLIFEPIADQSPAATLLRVCLLQIDALTDVIRAGLYPYAGGKKLAFREIF
jgi:hypothetical protein